MRKVNFLVFLVLGVALFSSCVSKRGVQFYSGDKNNDVIASNVELASQKRLDLQSQILRLQRQKDVVVMGIDRQESRDIMRREAEVRRLEIELQRLAAPQRGESNLTEYEEKLAQLEAKKEELELIKNSSQAYEANVAPMDTKIQNLESMLLSLEMAENQALANNLAESSQDYFEGNLKSGNEAANAYSLMKWSQRQGQELETFEGIIINDRAETVVITMKHSNGWRMVYDIPSKSTLEVSAPFPGDYTISSRYKNGYKTGTTSVVKTKKVFHEGKTYYFRIKQT